MVNKFYSICAAKNITAVVKKVASSENPADKPSRTVIKPLDPSRHQKYDPLFSAPVRKVTRDEVLDFWSRVFQMNLPKESVRLWTLKMMNPKNDMKELKLHL